MSCRDSHLLIDREKEHTNQIASRLPVDHRGPLRPPAAALSQQDLHPTLPGLCFKGSEGQKGDHEKKLITRVLACL